ncbi:MAG: nitroreductase family deazaflavin-dependent oxidoreductase [Sciscionella sp.]|nr:nitroreductase family deazaflavin-dependent oxidoreductase [Sciscionella sp.]
MSLLEHRPGKALRLVFKAPVWLYRARLGWLLGNRFVYFAHVGRRTGARRETVVEVVRHDADEITVVSGYGERADWYRNLKAAPPLEVRLGSHRYLHPDRRFLTDEQAINALADYANRHPRAWRRLASAFGLPPDNDPEQLSQAVRRLRFVAFTRS